MRVLAKMDAPSYPASLMGESDNWLVVAESPLGGIAGALS